MIKSTTFFGTLSVSCCLRNNLQPKELQRSSLYIYNGFVCGEEYTVCGDKEDGQIGLCSWLSWLYMYYALNVALVEHSVCHEPILYIYIYQKTNMLLKSLGFLYFNQNTFSSKLEGTSQMKIIEKKLDVL